MAQLSVGAIQTTRVSRRGALERLAQIGLLARGAVYLIIGVLAVEVAAGAGGKTTNQQGALKTVASEPFGKVMLIFLAIGLAGYAIFRLTEGAVGPGRGGDQGVGRRVAAVGSGIAYGAICITAIEIMASGRTSSSGSSPGHATAGILGWPAGPALVVAAGVVIVVVGLYQAYRGLAGKFLEDSRTEQMSPGTRRTFTALGVFGHCARAVIFVMIGYGVIKAALDYAPRQAIGLDGALANLARSSSGPLLLGIVALGFVAFGLYSIADSRYHRVMRASPGH